MKTNEMIIEERNERNDAARSVYLDLKKSLSNDTVNLIKEKGLKLSEINADMALFRQKKNGSDIVTYYDRVEVKKGKTLKVLPFGE